MTPLESKRLKLYTQTEEALVWADEEDEALAEQIRTFLDFLWWELSEEEHKVLNSR